MMCSCFSRPATIVFLLAIATLPTHPAMAEPRGLVIGIDKYKSVGELDGAVNDARDIADALRTVGVKDLTVLFDEQVTRKAVLDGWDGMMKRTRPGDTLFFTYAGHGGEEPELVKGSEETGKDQVLLFPLFDPRTENNAERLIDNEIALMLKPLPRQGVTMMMDACHSGTMPAGSIPGT
ncbi:metacaspase-1 [Gammaproteobacteria bacterium]